MTPTRKQVQELLGENRQLLKKANFLEEQCRKIAGQLRYLANSVDFSEPGSEHHLHALARELEELGGGTTE